MEECSIKAQDLTKQFGRLTAVDRVSFCVKPGEVYSLLGPNGAGKTTTIKMLATLLQPTAGEAWIKGHSILREPHMVRRAIGLVPQDLTADDELTGWENVVIQAKLYGFRGAEAERRAKEALDFMGLLEAAQRRVSTYSGGMRRRLEVAMSLVHSPEVLFLDEPTLGLDVQSRRHLWGLIEELRRQGKTILLTTHYMEEAEALADRVAIIDHGRIVAEGSPEELKSRIKGETIHVRLRDPGQTIALAEKLSKELGVDAEAKGDTVTVRVKSSAETLPGLVQVVSGMPVVEIRIVKPNLEEVFLELTGRGLRDEEFDAFKFRVMARRVRR